MTFTMTYNFGDVLLVPFPFTDQGSVKRRPTVVISSTLYNQQHIDIILIAVTSQSRAVRYPDNLALQQWHQAGLLKPSVIKPIVTTIANDLIIKKLGSLVSQNQQKLQQLLKRILGH
ncbi:MAG: type II toxin-antitoxin system PemK/MazF family toxin [Cyanobacteria bacterium J06650_10]